ncbi:Translocation protein S62 [Rhizophlyctis rosea]|nr:Translocation protein S62 [Rhizophlyctis rosea]
MDLKEVPKDILAAADYLKSSASGLKIRDGVLNGKRVQYFKGKHAVNALLRDQYQTTKNTPQIPDRPAGESLLSTLNRHGFFLKVDKPPKAKTLTLIPQQNFVPDAYYAWIYEGNTWWNTVLGTGVLAVVFAGVLFPLWPMPMRTGVYYLSLGLLGLMGVFMAMCVFRLVLWLVLKVTTGRDGWLFPNLFADVGVVESFIPTWGWDDKKPKKKSGKSKSDKSAKAVAAASDDGNGGDTGSRIEELDD